MLDVKTKFEATSVFFFGPNQACWLWLKLGPNWTIIFKYTDDKYVNFDTLVKPAKIWFKNKQERGKRWIFKQVT